MFRALALTVFPEMFPGALAHSLAGSALRAGLWQLEALSIRAFARDKHHTIDDTPYGGGAGMVMRPDVLDRATLAAKEKLPEATLIYFTPRGVPLSQSLVQDLAQRDLILLCGRFEGVDERYLAKHQPLEISVCDAVLSGGEIPALLLLDACVRLLPGVMGGEETLHEESFATEGAIAGLLEYPHYTRPRQWEGMDVPEVLLSGDHAAIANWRLGEAENLTKSRRPDLWAARELRLAGLEGRDAGKSSSGAGSARKRKG